MSNVRALLLEPMDIVIQTFQSKAPSTPPFFDPVKLLVNGKNISWYEFQQFGPELALQWVLYFQKLLLMDDGGSEPSDQNASDIFDQNEGPIRWTRMLRLSRRRAVVDTGRTDNTEQVSWDTATESLKDLTI